jgi:hypothetical protein
MGLFGRLFRWSVETVAGNVVGAIALALLAGTSVSALFAGLMRHAGAMANADAPTVLGAIGIVLSTVLLAALLSALRAIAGPAANSRSPTNADASVVTASPVTSAAVSTASPENGPDRVSSGGTGLGDHDPAASVSNISVETLVGLFVQHTGVQANRLLSVYVGHYVEISGKLNDVKVNDYGDAGQAMVHISYKTSGVSIFALFPSSWVPSLSILRVDAHVTVRGRIEGAGRFEVTLHDCRLVS